MNLSHRFCSIFAFAATLPGIHAATFTVTTTAISGPGSLPVVVAQANATPGDNLIQFAVSNTITLAFQLPTFINNVTINGRTDVPTIISGGGALPIFNFAAGTTNILSRLVLVNGYTTNGGAAINNASTLFVSNCALTNNHVPGGFGGAVSNGGTMTIVSSTIAGNQAGDGGGIFNGAAMTLADLTISENQAGSGGGIHNTGTLALNGLTVSNNQATEGFGGGLLNSGTVSILASTICNNSASGASGGDGSNIDRDGGSAGGGGSGALGGGVFSISGTVAITNCTFSGNSVTGGSGGIGRSRMGLMGASIGGNGGGIGGGKGGGGYLYSHIFYTDRGAGFSGTLNGGGGGGCGDTRLPSDGGGYKGGPGGAGGTLGGGGGGGGGHVIYTSESYPGGVGPLGGGAGGRGTFTNYNSVYIYGFGGGGGGGAGVGAAVFVQSGNVTLVNCTVTMNLAIGGQGGATDVVVYSSGARLTGVSGSPGKGTGGGICNLSGTVKLLNTIVAGNTGASSSPDLYGLFISSGFNLIGNNQGATNLSINDFQNVPAGLGPLQDNGGPTLTCALLQGSLAIGAGTSVGAPPTDQRGIARPPGRCDIGAFQLQTLITPIIAWANPADIVWGTALSSNQLNATVGAAGTLTYTPPAGTILPAGSNQALKVVFTPDDPSQYTSATNSVAINVQKASQTITFNPIPNQLIGNPPLILAASASSGLPVTFSLLSGPANLTGNLLSLGSTNGWITVAATQSGNSNYSAAPEVDQTFYLGTFPLPLITVPPTNLTVYPGDRVTFNVVATNGPLNYQWQFNSANVPGGTAATLVLARVQASHAGPYRVVVSNPSGSVTSAVANLTVIVTTGTPQIVGQPQNQILRVGENAQLAVSATGNAPLYFQWYRGGSGDTGGLIGGATNANYVAGGLTTNTSFWVSVHNSLGTVDSDTAAVTVYPAKAARLKMGTLYGLAALVIDGVPGTSYEIDYCTDAGTTNWTPLINLVLPSNPYTFIDSSSPGAQRRFYRTIAH